VFDDNMDGEGVIDNNDVRRVEKVLEFYFKRNCGTFRQLSQGRRYVDMDEININEKRNNVRDNVIKLGIVLTLVGAIIPLLS